MKRTQKNRSLKRANIGNRNSNRSITASPGAIRRDVRNMSSYLLALNWIVAIFFFALAIIFSLLTPPAAFPLFLIAVLFAPPVHEFLEEKFDRQIGVKTKTFATLSLLSAFIICFASYTVQERKRAFQAAIAQEKAEAEVLRQQRLSDFQARRQSIIVRAQTAMQEKRFKDLIIATNEYEAFGDLELQQLRSVAKEGLLSQQAAEERERKQKRDAARVKEILVEIATLPEENHKRNRDLYVELAKLTPGNAEVTQKLSYHQKEYNQEIQKERRAAEETARDMANRAEQKKKIEAQFSSWDGSHRNLEKEVKSRMHNPASYKHVSTSFINVGTHLIVNTTFRGTNAFGGIVTNSMRAKVDFDGNIIEMLEP